MRYGRRWERGRTIRVQRLTVGRTDAEDTGDKDVLERGDEEEGRVLETDDIELLGVDNGRDVPARVVSLALWGDERGTHHS